MKYLIPLIFAVMAMNVQADETMRDVKTANPCVALHPAAQQDATADYYEAVEKMYLMAPFPLSTRSLRRSLHPWR